VTMRDRPKQIAIVDLVITGDVDAAKITQMVGTEPTESRRFCSPLRGREVTEWVLELGSGSMAWQTVRDATERLFAFGIDTADRIARLTEDGDTTVTLVIIQNLADDTRTKGLEFSADALKWLARANARLGIDQYVWQDVREFGLEPEEEVTFDREQ
jgi:hypothetical protein